MTAPLTSHGGGVVLRSVRTPSGWLHGKPTWAGAGPCLQTGRGTAWAAAPFRAAGAPHRLRKRGRAGEQTTQIRPEAAHAVMRHASQLDAAACDDSPSPATEEKSVPEMLLTTVVSTVGCCCTAGGCGAPGPVVQQAARDRRERGRRWWAAGWQAGKSSDVHGCKWHAAQRPQRKPHKHGWHPPLPAGAGDLMYRCCTALPSPMREMGFSLAARANEARTCWGPAMQEGAGTWAGRQAGWQ